MLNLATRALATARSMYATSSSQSAPVALHAPGDVMRISVRLVRLASLLLVASLPVTALCLLGFGLVALWARKRP